MATSIVPESDVAVIRNDSGRFLQGSINLVVAAVAMTATLPGRTYGLGLITKALTTDPQLSVDEPQFSVMNFWAVLIGSALCVPVGRMIDRFGVRGVLVGVASGLGLAVIGMSVATDVIVLFITLTLVRGLGQGALSVVSLAMIGKWFTRRLPIAMGVFSVLLAFGFGASIGGVGELSHLIGWRAAWMWVGIFLLAALAPLGALLVRNAAPTDTNLEQAVASGALDQTLGQALRSPAFWTFTLACSFFNLTFSAVTLFNESVLTEKGFNEEMAVTVLMILGVMGLVANIGAGFLAQRWPMGRLLALGMLLLAGSLGCFPLLDSTAELMIYAAALGASGGIVTVIFFAVYGRAFGRRHLGLIQATVQIVTVFASASGPWLLQQAKGATGSFTVFFYVAALVSIVLGLAAWLTPLPQAERSV